MKNKTPILILALAIFLICCYYLSFTFLSSSVNREATAFATSENGTLNEDKKRKYLDSLWVSDEPVRSFLFTEYTYKEIKQFELPLGLDLQGGMHVTLEVSPVEIIKALAANNRNKEFREALALAQKNQQNSQQNFVDLFADAYEEVAPDGKLSRLFTNTTTRGKISLSSDNKEVIELIRTEVNDAFDRTFNIIRTRIDKFGVTNPNIQKLSGTNRIMVELPGVKNPERVRKLLSGVAKLEFWEVWETQEIFPYFEQFAAYLSKEQEVKRAAGKVDTGTADESSPETSLDAPTSDEESTSQDDLLAGTSEITTLNAEDSVEESDDGLIIEDPLEVREDTLLASQEDSTNESPDDALLIADDEDSTSLDSNLTAENIEADSATVADSVQNQNALAAELMYPVQEGFMVQIKDTAKVNAYLNRSEVRSLFPPNLKFLWAVKPVEEQPVIYLYAIKRGRGGKAPLEGDVIIDARSDIEEGEALVNMQMNPTGAKIWKKMTGANVNRRIAIVLDDVVYSAPRVNGEIPTGNSQISGSFTVNEAKDLANILKAGKLPAPARIVEEATVGPSLGKESISQGLRSMLIGLGIVVILMVVYYQSGGLVADFALLINIFFIVGILAQLHAVLTLAGMAGIVLTIGMSVDANVLIYERIREELRNKKSYKNAIKLGYEKAYSSIIDANATTFLTGVILYSFGSGGVKGFAVTLMIGIVCSLFSAIFITRLIIEYFSGKSKDGTFRFDSLLFKNSFDKIKIDFIGKRKLAYIFSSAIITVGIVLLFVQGLTLGVDFKGGRSYVVQFEEPVSVLEARQTVGDQFEGSTEIKTFGGNNKLKITTSYLIEDESREADEKVQATLLKGLEAFQDKNPEIISFSKVGATIADDIANTSYLAVGFSLFVIFTYIVFRFRKWQYGLGALVALLHDVMVVIAFMGIAKLLGFSYEVDQVFIAAMLTVVGYSINDTVVVFDRIREFAGDTQSRSFPESLNNAINNTLSRTIMTSTTTLVVILILFLAGGEVLRGFSYSLLIGVLIGTYSSVFIASPIVLDISLLQQQTGSKKVAAKTK